MRLFKICFILIELRIFFIGLALCDSINCLASIILRGFPSFGNKDVDAFGFTVSWVMGPLSYITWTCSIFLTVFLSFKLYSVICREKLVTNKRTYQVEGRDQ